MRASRLIQKFAAVLGALMCMGTVQAQSTSSPSARVLSADVVAYARCETVTTEWRGGKVFSIAHYKVLDSIKGAPDESIAVSVLGGTAVHPQLNVPITTEVSHGVKVQAGEEAIIYLRSGTNRSGVLEHRLLSKDAVAANADGARHVINRSRTTRKDVVVPARSGTPATVVVRHARPTVEEFVQLMKDTVKEQ